MSYVFFTNNKIIYKTGNAPMTSTMRRVRVTIVAVEKQ
jgi:hypothetical protein